VSCLFCDIAAGKVKAKVVHQDDAVMAFRDINPQAPTHILVIPRRHITSLVDLTEADDALVGRLVRTGRDLARQENLADRGFRVLFNAGDDAGYSVYHIHLHLVGGRQLGWPPG
jgi:histidine triad (HIT) family protein